MDSHVPAPLIRPCPPGVRCNAWTRPVRGPGECTRDRVILGCQEWIKATSAMIPVILARFIARLPMVWTRIPLWRLRLPTCALQCHPGITKFEQLVFLCICASIHFVTTWQRQWEIWALAHTTKINFQLTIGHVSFVESERASCTTDWLVLFFSIILTGAWYAVLYGSPCQAPVVSYSKSAYW